MSVFPSPISTSVLSVTMQPIRSVFPNDLNVFLETYTGIYTKFMPAYLKLPPVVASFIIMYYSGGAGVLPPMQMLRRLSHVYIYLSWCTRDRVEIPYYVVEHYLNYMTAIYMTKR